MHADALPQTEAIGVRLTAEEREKLQSLAMRTGRTMSAVLRILLAQAQVADTPDLVLAGARTGGRTHEPEATGA
jgi:predicted DNA-binding protein